MTLPFQCRPLVLSLLTLTSGCGEFRFDQPCHYKTARHVGQERETIFGTPRDVAEQYVGTYVIRPGWGPGEAGVPLPGELDALLLDVQLIEGPNHDHAKLKSDISEPWCPEESLAVALEVRLRNEDGSFMAAGVPPNTFLMAEHAGRVPTFVRVPVIKYPERWAAFTAPSKPGRSFDRFEIALNLPSTWGGVLPEARMEGTGIDIEVYEDVPAADGVYSTWDPFTGFVWVAEPAP